MELEVDIFISKSIMLGGLLSSYFILIHRMVLTYKKDTSIVNEKYCVNV